MKYTKIWILDYIIIISLKKNDFLTFQLVILRQFISLQVKKFTKCTEYDQPGKILHQRNIKILFSYINKLLNIYKSETEQ